MRGEFRAQVTLNSMCNNITRDVAKKLLCALSLFSHHNKKLILMDKNNIEHFTFASDNDLQRILPGGKEEEQIASWVEEAKKIANGFLRKLTLAKEGVTLFDAIQNKLREKNMMVSQEEIDYLVAKNFSDLSKNLSWPQRLMDLYPSVSGAVRQNSGKLREVFRGLIMQGKLVLCQSITYRKPQMNHSVC